jgi:DOPA 4,5-dioxygenase
MTTPSPQALAAIASFHAHVYFDGPEQRETALALREQIGQRFAVAMGRVHDVPIGPHARAMYQVAFDVGSFGKIVPWLMLNRQGLTVLVHTNTRNERADHLSHALWMGEVLDIVDPQQLAADMDAEGPRPTSTTPSMAP